MTVNDPVVIEVAQWWIQNPPPRQKVNEIFTSDGAIEVNVAEVGFATIWNCIGVGICNATGNIADIRDAICIAVVHRTDGDLTVVGYGIEIAILRTSVLHTHSREWRRAEYRAYILRPSD